MTGRELIKWLQDNNAEDKEIIVEHRDSGGTYWTAERLETPRLVQFGNEAWGIIDIIRYGVDDPNGVML